MIIKPRVKKKCSECGYFKVTSFAEYGCDHCKSPIEIHGKEHHYLQMDIFYKGDNIDTEHREYCSWSCALADLKSRDHEGVDFINLPYLTFDRDMPVALQTPAFLKEVK